MRTRARITLAGLLVLAAAAAILWLMTREDTARPTKGEDGIGPATSGEPPAPAPQLQVASIPRSPDQAAEAGLDDAKPGSTNIQEGHAVHLEVRASVLHLEQTAVVTRAYLLRQETETSFKTLCTFEVQQSDGGAASFVVSGVPAGVYMVVVEVKYGGQPIETHQRLVIEPDAPRKIAMEVVWDAGTSGAETHQLLVRVVDEDGEPVKGARIFPTHRKTTSKGSYWTGLQGSWTTDASGEASLAAPPGKYLLRVESPSHASHQQRFEVAADCELTVTLRRGTVTWTVQPKVSDPDIVHFQCSVHIKTDDASWTWRSLETRVGDKDQALAFRRLLADERHVMLLTGRKAAAQFWMPFEDGTTSSATWKVKVTKGRMVKVVVPRAIPESDLEAVGVLINYEGMLGQLFTETRAITRLKDGWALWGLADVGAHVRIRWQGRSFVARLSAKTALETRAELRFEEE